MDKYWWNLEPAILNYISEFSVYFFFLICDIHLAFLGRSWKYKRPENWKWTGPWSIHTSERPVSTLCSFFRHSHATHIILMFFFSIWRMWCWQGLFGLSVLDLCFQYCGIFRRTDVKLPGKSNAVVSSHGSSERLLCMPLFLMIFHYIKWDLGNFLKCYSYFCGVVILSTLAFFHIISLHRTWVVQNFG